MSDLDSESFTEHARAVSLDDARATIAAVTLGDEPEQLRIGDIALHPHQRSAVARIQRTIQARGGALLCDRVGLGKTYVALAVAARYDSITVIAPAALASMWQYALAATRLRAEFISVEALGRSGGADRRRSFIIVDEAHHFRNSCTRRYAALAHMCVLAHVLLLTATPLHNSRDDISAIAALFLGSRAYSMSETELSTILVRRETAETTEQSVPFVEHIAPVVLQAHEWILDMILSLPAPVPASDGEVARQLVFHGLARQWASSNAALVAALKRRIARSHGLLASLDAGRYPTTAELAAWVYTGDAVQLAFTEWLPPAVTPLATLTAALHEHVDALASLLAAARTLDDAPLATFVADIRRKHRGEKIVVFSSYAETAITVYRSLRPAGHVALLTARGAMIASGPVRRAEVLAQFAPSPERCCRDAHAEIDLLVATDLLSEGVNLQEASVVVHLDLPWTSARIDQRIGRLARLGSRHQRVVSYSVNPPARTEAFLKELETIARKSHLATRIFGDASRRDDPRLQRSAIEDAEGIRSTFARWRGVDVTPIPGEVPRVALADAPDAASLGVWIVDGNPILLVWNDLHGIESEPTEVHAVVRRLDFAADRAADAADAVRVCRILAAAEAWYEQRCAWVALGDFSGTSGGPFIRSHQKSLARIADAATTNILFARRAHATSIAARLRGVAGPPLPLAVEWSLESLAGTLDEASVDTILDIVEQVRHSTAAVREKGIRCLAVIVANSEPVAR